MNFYLFEKKLCYCHKMKNFRRILEKIMKIEQFCDIFSVKVVLFLDSTDMQKNCIFVISMVDLVGINVHMFYIHNMKSQL